ncbi:MAG: cytochrome P450 [Alphaproteobacteria bacterium]
MAASFLHKQNDLDVLEAYPEAAHDWYVGKFSPGFTDVYTVNDLDCIQHMMVTEVENYPKSRYVMRTLFPLIGDGVFSSNGERWQSQREKIDPSLSQLHLKRAFPAMRDAANAMEKRLQKAGNAGKPFDLMPEFSTVTADAIFRVMFSLPLEDELAQSIYDNFQLFQKSMTGLKASDFTSLPSWLPLGGRKSKGKTDGEKAAAALRDVARTIIERRITDDTPPDDMLTIILNGYRAEHGDDLPIEEVVDQIAFFFLAGHETLASALSWAAYMLASAPFEEQRMRAEMKEVIGEDVTEEITFAHVRQLDFTRAVFREAMRLYPPVPYYPREAAVKDQLRSHKVKPGAQCSVIPYFLHRHSKYWRDPHKFIPERFMPGNMTKLEKRSYIPFGYGPRICPGAAFATIEAGLILATIYRKFTFILDKNHEVLPLARLTLRPRTGVMVTAQNAVD